MKFVCERIPKEYRERFNLKELDEQPTKALGRSTSWAVNEDHSIWVRKYYEVSDHTAVGGGYTGLSGWNFYWKGSLMLVELEHVDYGGGLDDDHRWSIYRLIEINIPKKLEHERVEIFQNLESALFVYTRKFGASSPKSYSFTLQYDERSQQ